MRVASLLSPLARVASAVGLASSLAVGALFAQGITTAAVRGRILDEAGGPVVSAVVVLTNTSTGQRFQGITREGGLYNVENVAVGGPYTLDARSIGFRPARREGIMLFLGQAVEIDLRLAAAAVEVAPVTVAAEEVNPLTSASRTGMAAFISDTAIARLPTLNRNFTDFVLTVPQVEGTSIAGQHNRMNNIQIDGASNNDLFGLGSTGQPGGQVDAKSISLEAVREYQVLIAPFDVRHSGFSGGLVNAVTKRGTNRWRGSIFEYYQTEGLVGDFLQHIPRAGQPDSIVSVKFGEYLQHQYGLTLGGPLVQNRAHFFGAFEWQTREFPIGGNTIGREDSTQVGILARSAQRLVDILRNTYDVDAGSYGAVTIPQPNRNFFARVDLQLSDAHTLTLRNNYVDASDDNISHSTTFYRLSSNTYTIQDKTNSFVAQLNSTLGRGRYYNELLLGYQRIRDRRNPASRFPELTVGNRDTIGGTEVRGTFVLGAERYSQANELDQDIFEITDNLTFARGAHTITVGTHNEFIHFRNLFFQNSTGQWFFDNLDSLEAGRARRFVRSIPYSDAALGLPGFLQKGVPVADWAVAQYGGYLQDQWNPTPTLSVTAGLRFDVPGLPDYPAYNGAADSAFGIRTDVVPSGNILWAPRLGVNWALNRERTTVVRGGVGVFSGRPAYVWLSNAYTNTGRETLDLSCSGARVPTFTVDPDNQPSACATAGGVSAPTAVVNFFERSFKFPQQFKISAAVDRTLPFGLLGTVEFLYTRTLNSIQLQEMNLQTRAAGDTLKDGRPLYGTLPTSSSDGLGSVPRRVNSAFGQVLRHRNNSRDRSYSLTFQLQRRFSRGYELSAGYTYANARDLTSLSSSIATSNFGYTPIGGDPNNPPLGVSAFDIPHKIVLSGTVNLPFYTTLTLFYTGNSGRPYTWTYRGDVNADGYQAANITRRDNDIVYVPRNSADFRGRTASDWPRLDSLINSEQCLRESRGRILERNTCRNPWRTRLDTRLTFSPRAFQFRGLTVTLDIFNLMNLLNSDWGRVRSVTGFETINLLRLRGYDTATKQGIFEYFGPTIAGKEFVSDLASRWRLQLGVRFDR